MNSPNKKVDPLAHKIREALESRQENANSISCDHIATMRFWDVCGGVEKWTHLEEEHLRSCERCRIRESRVSRTVAESDRPAAGRRHDPVMEVTVSSEGGLAIGDPNSPNADEVCVHTTLSTGMRLKVQLRRDERGAPQDELHLTIECEDVRSVGRLLALDISGSESVTSSFIMLAPSQSGHPRSHRKWSTSMMASQVGENVQLWLEEKTLCDIGVFEAELFSEAARLAGLEERRIWLAWAEMAMSHVAVAELSKEELSSSLKSEDVVLRMHATLVSARVSAESASCIRGLIELLEDPEEAVRFAAVQSLGDLKQTESVKPLLRCLKDEPLVRRAVAKAVGRIRAEASIPVLVQLLAADPQPEVRESICHALGRLGTEAAVQELCRAVREEQDDYVRSAAYQALTGIDSPAAVQALVHLRNEEPADSLPDLPAYVSSGSGLALAGDEIVPHFLLPALYGAAVASLSSPMDGSTQDKEVGSQQASGVWLKDSPIHSLALGDSSTDAGSTNSESNEPIRKWKWGDVCEKTPGTATDAATLAAEWSATHQVLSVWLEAPAAATGRPIEVQWLNAEGKACTQTVRSDENGIAVLPSSESPAFGDRLVVGVSVSEGQTFRWEVAFPS